MAQSGNTKLKVLYLYDVFRTQTDADHRLGVPELARKMQEAGIIVERKSIYRDIEALIEYGIDIKQSPTGYYLQNRQFENSELRLLISAVQAASFISVPRTEALIEKLLRLTSEPQAEIMRRQTNIGGVKCASDEIFRTIEMVNLAIAQGWRIGFFYTKRDISKRNVIQRKGQSYHVSPYAMIWMQDRYYLVGNMDGRDNLTHFRLDRMQNVQPEALPARPCSEVSPYMVKFDAADYAKKCVNMFGGEVIRITLRAEMRLVSDILDRFGGDIVLRRDPEDEDYFFAYVQAADGVGFISWVAQYGAAIEIREPQPLRDAMKKRLEDAALLYCRYDGTEV